MAPKNPLGRLADNAINTLKNPRDTAEKLFEQAKGTAAFGKMVAEQVGKTAVSKASETAGAVVERASGRGPASKESTSTPSTSAPRAAASPLRSVPDVNEAGHTPAENRGEPSTESPAARKAAAEKAVAKKTTAKKTATKKAASKKTTAKRTTTKRAPSKKAASKKATAKKTTTKEAPAKKAPVEKPVEEVPPKTAEQVVTDQGDDVTTPAGTPAAAAGTNPDTTEHALDQPGTEGIVEESTAKAAAKEAETLRKAAEQNPEE